MAFTVTAHLNLVFNK